MVPDRADPDALLRRHPYFAGLPAAIRREVRQRSVTRVYERGAVVYSEGDRGPGLYVIVGGTVRTFKSSEAGKEQDLHHMGPGESFNDVAAFDGGVTAANAEAIERAVVLHVPREALVDLMRRYPEIPLAVVGVLAGRLRELSDLAGDLSLRHVVSRVARVLVRLAERGPVVTLPAAHELAARVGTVREVVARALAQLEGLGVIRLGPARRATVTDVDALVNIGGSRWPTERDERERRTSRRRRSR